MADPTKTLGGALELDAGGASVYDLRIGIRRTKRIHTARIGRPAGHGMLMQDAATDDPLSAFCAPIRELFAGRFPDGPTAAQASSWPVIARGGNLLLISPTGTGKTFAAFFAII